MAKPMTVMQVIPAIKYVLTFMWLVKWLIYTDKRLRSGKVSLNQPTS
mgnify:CR=1 FL=1|jgi:hypothetical protein